MTTNKIAFRYAKSWIDLAVERNEVESALADVKVLKNLLRENADFSAFVKSPVISFDKKKKILSTLFEDKLSKLTLLFLQLLVSKGYLKLPAFYLFKFKVNGIIEVKKFSIDEITFTKSKTLIEIKISNPSNCKRNN